MKAILTIEVSRKGGKDCLARIGKWCGALNETECNADNCPLEIQYDTNDLQDGKLYRVIERFYDCCSCKYKWSYDEAGYVLCKIPECIKRENNQ